MGSSSLRGIWFCFSLFFGEFCIGVSTTSTTVLASQHFSCVLMVCSIQSKWEMLIKVFSFDKNQTGFEIKIINQWGKKTLFFVAFIFSHFFIVYLQGRISGRLLLPLCKKLYAKRCYCRFLSSPAQIRQDQDKHTYF